MKLFRATTLFADQDGRTRLTLSLHCDTVAERDGFVQDVGAIEGGTSTLQRLAEYLTTMS